MVNNKDYSNLIHIYKIYDLSLSIAISIKEDDEDDDNGWIMKRMVYHKYLIRRRVESVNSTGQVQIWIFSPCYIYKVLQHRYTWIIH